MLVHRYIQFMSNMFRYQRRLVYLYYNKRHGAQRGDVNASTEQGVAALRPAATDTTADEKGRKKRPPKKLPQKAEKQSKKQLNASQ